MPECGGWLVVDGQAAAQQDRRRLSLQLCRGSTRSLPAREQIDESHVYE